MWKVDDCFTHGYVFYYLMCQSFLSGRVLFSFSTMVFDLSIIKIKMVSWIFDLFLPVADKFPCQISIGLDEIFKLLLG